MFLDIKDLELHPIEFTEEFQPGVIDLISDVRQLTPLLASGRAELVEEHHGKHEVIQDIRLRGKLATRLEISTVSRLEPFGTSFWVA